MENHCRNIQQKIAKLITEDLSPEEKNELQIHLNGCHLCREYFKGLQSDDKRMRVFSNAINTTVARLEDNVLAAIDRLPSKENVHTISIWKTIMKSRLTKFAAAAVVIIAVCFGIFQITKIIDETGAAFADVLNQVLKARTVTFKMTGQEEEEPPGSTQTIMIMEPGHIRVESPNGDLSITDARRGEMLGISHKRKIAVLTTWLNQPAALQSQNLIEQWKNLHQNSGKFIGQEKIDGQAADMFIIQEKFRETTVWADPTTNLPMQIREITIPRPDYLLASQQKQIVTISDFVWNPDLDESLFSMEIPEGYELIEMQQDMSEATEQDLIESLRLWSTLRSGAFPSKFDGEAFGNLSSKIEKDSQAMLDNQRQLSEQELKEKFEVSDKIHQVWRGLRFAQQMIKEGNWHYAGDRVQLGDADKPICWWRPKGSKTYRIMYGDLSVRDAEPDDLRETPTMEEK